MQNRWVRSGVVVVLLSVGLSAGHRVALAQDATTPEKALLVQKVTFQGAKHIKESDLREITGIKAGMPVNPRLNQVGCRKILDKYAEMGRSFSSCQLVKGGDPGDTEVIYQITEGPKVKVRDIQFTGNTFVRGSRLMQKCAATPIGGTYNKQNVESAIDDFVALYQSFGYRDVKVSLETQRSADGGEITLFFHVQEGKRSRPQTQTKRVGQIFLVGNERISAESILAHVPLYPGQVLTYPELRQAEKTLAKLGLFVVDPANGIRPTITVADRDGVYKDLVITVKEKPLAKGSECKSK
jgi:outer membrane protein assembly factor BamA